MAPEQLSVIALTFLLVVSIYFTTKMSQRSVPWRENKNVFQFVIVDVFHDIIEFNRFRQNISIMFTNLLILHDISISSEIKRIRIILVINRLFDS